MRGKSVFALAVATALAAAAAAQQTAPKEGPDGPGSRDRAKSSRHGKC
jgi:hypothetical protein